MNGNRNSKLVSLIVILAALALSAFGATTGTLSLSGTVASILEIVVNPDPAASALPITTTVADSKIATVIERSNKKAGYTVTLQTANGALLKGQTGNSDNLAYSLKYAGANVNFVLGSATISAVASKTAPAGTSKDLTISFDGASSFLVEDTYSDTLTFTMTSP
jgi:hypothetical protein